MFSPRLPWLCLALALPLALFILLVSRLASVAPGPLTTEPLAGPAGLASPSPLLIAAVLYDGYVTGDRDEAVRLQQVSSTTLSLAGWSLGDGGSSRAQFPAGAELGAGQAIWVTRDAVAFTRQFGFRPDYELGDTDPLVPDLSGSWPGYSNSGDEVILTDAADRPADVLVYLGGDTSRPGWQGAAVRPYRNGSLFGVEGQILFRRRHEATGALLPDTDRAADWAQGDGTPPAGPLVQYPGWDLDQFFRPPLMTATGRITIAVAPDNAYSATLALIQSAQSRIQMAGLTFDHVGLAGALTDAADRGVSVTVLLEGGPAGGLSDQGRYVCQRLAVAGGACWFMITDDEADVHARYRYMHAKYLVLDRRLGVVSSENWSPRSLPDDDKSDGTWGRRGILLLTDAPGVVAHLEHLFAADLDPAWHRDLQPWHASHPIYGAPPAGFVPVTATGGTTYSLRYPAPTGWSGTFTFSLIQSPEHSLRQTDSLLGLLQRVGPGDEIRVQQLSEPPYWRPAGAAATTPTGSLPNPRLEAYLAAARRGARVRVLLDAYFDDPASPSSNRQTCRLVTEMARSEGLDLACRTGNPAGLGLHNKMVLVRHAGQGIVMVGSLNGTELAHKGNRELIVQVWAEGPYNFLAELFDRDWPENDYLPLVARRLVGRAAYPLIGEVLYDPAGPDAAEFVELVNPLAEAVDLSGYSLGDAVSPNDFEDLRRFPAGSWLPAGGVLVVATAATAFVDAFGFRPDYEILDSDPATPDLVDDLAWGDPAAFFQLGNGGDEVILRDRADRPVDVLVYGTGIFPGHPACPTVTAPGRSLERFPYWRDTDDCPADFRDWPFPNPGWLSRDPLAAGPGPTLMDLRLPTTGRPPK